MSHVKTVSPPTFASLPGIARTYVASVVCAGALCLLDAATQLRFDHAGLFALLLALGVATSAAKIDLPLGRSQSNLSLSHAVNFWALFALGPAEAVCIATVSAWAQCTLRVGARNPLHRILFSIGSLTLTVVARGRCRSPLAHGSAPPGFASLARTAAVVAPLYFFINTALVAARDRASRRASRSSRVWQRNFFWSAPSYLAGAALAAIATAAPSRGWFGWLALLAVPLYLVFRSYHTVVARLREEQDRNAPRDGRAARHDRSARAGDRSQGRLHARAHPIDPAVRGDARGGRRAVRRGGPGASAPRRCCTTSATWRCPSTSCRSPRR